MGNHDESASDDGETPILSRTPTGVSSSSVGEDGWWETAFTEDE